MKRVLFFTLAAMILTFTVVQAADLFAPRYFASPLEIVPDCAGRELYSVEIFNGHAQVNVYCVDGTGEKIDAIKTRTATIFNHDIDNPATPGVDETQLWNIFTSGGWYQEFETKVDAFIKWRFPIEWAAP